MPLPQSQGAWKGILSRRRGFITPEGGCPAGEVLLRRRGFITPERPPLCEGAAPKGLLKAAAPGGQGRPFRRGGGRLPFGEGGTIPTGLFRRGEGPLPGCPPPRERAAEGLPPETAGKVQLFWTRCVSKGKTGPKQPGAAAGPKRPTPLGPGAKPGRPLRAGGRSAGGCSPLPQNPRKGGVPGGRSPFCPSRPVFFHLYLQEEVQPCSPSTKSIRPPPAWS